MSQYVFLCLLHIDDGKKCAKLFFESLTKSMKEWGLDVDKCIAFSYVGAATIIGKNT